MYEYMHTCIHTYIHTYTHVYIGKHPRLAQLLRAVWGLKKTHAALRQDLMVKDAQHLCDTSKVFRVAGEMTCDDKMIK